MPLSKTTVSLSFIVIKDFSFVLSIQNPLSNFAHCPVPYVPNDLPSVYNWVYSGNMTIEFTIFGEPASKANSRQLVTIKGRPAFIKSKKARNYVKDFEKQCPIRENLLEGELSVTMTIHYATLRPDLDESVILDAMQGRIYKNDRQVKEKHIYHALDRDNPRADIRVEARQGSD